MSLVLALILQVGPFVSAAERPVSPVPAELRERRSRDPARDPAAAATDDRLGNCLAAIEHNPVAALAAAGQWLAAATGHESARALRCSGSAHAALGEWDRAEADFLAARAVPGLPLAERAKLAAMAANAALAAGAAERALGLAGMAGADAGEGGALRAGIERDRARALVALKREAEAATALETARTADPDNGEGWLLSATLARRQGDLARAQSLIETAAERAPADPAVGLEAGVIAMLAGREAAARASWRAVVALAPDGAEGETARGYLAQLDESVTTGR